MNRALQEGKVQQAIELRQQLEEIMSANGFDFTAEEWQ
jgi:D-alanyl-D-alanine dipeptidase